MGRPRRDRGSSQSAAGPAPTPSRQLQVCPECDSDLVQPVDWAPVEGGSWRVELRCPDCGWGWAGVQSQEALDRFDATLDEATERMLDDLSKLERANMEEAAGRVSDALDRGLLLPEDF